MGDKLKKVLCGTCAAWQRHPKEVGTCQEWLKLGKCKANPPTIGAGDYGVWPITHESDYCFIGVRGQDND